MNLVGLALLFAVSATLSAQELKVDAQKSSLQWTGKKVGGSHTGFINLKSGNLVLKNDKITAGTFVIDMKSITNTDISDAETNGKLVGHLKSDDFFGVEKFGEATLVITSATAFKNNESNVSGNLTIKGITHPISFTVKRSGKTYTSTLVVDRSKYDVRYGSKSFFDNLGNSVIYDEFNLDVKIATL